ncbi:DUF6894 family protein [Sphingomonas sp. BK345]|uniref:DUF6894 family protein n=2 Tax=unclassified Sphingomonas TaxID=196159 RepID=UPI001618B064|nr:hypothetical protein [Sphingomonas sp. BK345]MBB3473183.1 hypothetical protein [Sphingomonas sp. BK345]
MPLFYFQFAGRERDVIGVNCTDVAEARNEGVRQLGSYLSDHPGYAEEGHWRVTVEDSSRRPLLNVIVATVNVRGAPDE